MITLPVSASDRWTVWNTVTETAVVRDRPWPGPLNELPLMDPGLVLLKQVPGPTLIYDSRIEVPVYPAIEVADLEASTIYKRNSLSLRPEAEIIAAVSAEAEQRKANALIAAGVSSPVDQSRALSLLLAARSGQTLTAQQEQFLGGLQTVGIDMLDAIDAKAAEIIAWVQANPGDALRSLDLSDSVWPTSVAAE